MRAGTPRAGRLAVACSGYLPFRSGNQETQPCVMRLYVYLLQVQKDPNVSADGAAACMVGSTRRRTGKRFLGCRRLWQRTPHPWTWQNGSEGKRRTRGAQRQTFRANDNKRGGCAMTLTYYFLRHGETEASRSGAYT